MPHPSAQLSLWKQRLGSVPEWVWERTELETLVLADNGLSEISDRIGRLKNLRTLDLGHNELTGVPYALGDLDGLTDFLYLHDNRLTSLPPSISRLTRLRYLNISENAFAALPESVGAMRELRQIDLRGNPLIGLPAGISTLPRLEKLDPRWVDTLELPSWVVPLRSNFRSAPCNLGNAFRVYFSINPVFNRRLLVVSFAMASAALARPVDDEQVFDIGPGIIPPRVTRQVTPVNKPDDERGFRISGTVLVGLVVSSQGEPKDVHVVKSLDKDIDQTAIDAVKQWHFDPAKKGDKPVAVRVTVEIRFHSM